MASDYLKTQLGTHLLRTASYTKPTQVRVALFTDAAVEVSGGSYARVTHGPSDATWEEVAGDPGLFQNLTDVAFPLPTADWGVIEEVRLYDQSGNELGRGDLDYPLPVYVGDTPPTFAPGTIRVRVT